MTNLYIADSTAVEILLVCFVISLLALTFSFVSKDELACLATEIGVHRSLRKATLKQFLFVEESWNTLLILFLPSLWFNWFYFVKLFPLIRTTIIFIVTRVVGLVELAWKAVSVLSILEICWTLSDLLLVFLDFVNQRLGKYFKLGFKLLLLIVMILVIRLLNDNFL